MALPKSTHPPNSMTTSAPPPPPPPPPPPLPLQSAFTFFVSWRSLRPGSVRWGSQRVIKGWGVLGLGRDGPCFC